MEKILDKLLASNIFQNLKNKKGFYKIAIKIEDKAFVMHMIKYILFGVLTTVVSLSSLEILLKLNLFDANLSNFISILIGIITAYILNRKYVFESKEKNILKEFGKFAFSRAFSSLFDMICFFVFATCFHFQEMLVKIVISVVVIILNYVLSKWLVFRK